LDGQLDANHIDTPKNSRRPGALWPAFHRVRILDCLGSALVIVRRRMLYIGTMDTQISVTVKLGFEQIQAIVDQLGPDEQKRLTEYLEKKTLRDDIRAFRAAHRDLPLTLEEIQAEVKAVRLERNAR